VALAIAFNRVILRPLVGHPAISLLMVTIGFGAVLRAVATLAFSGAPRAVPLPIPQEPIDLAGILIATDRLVAALVAAVCIAAVSYVFHRTRTGVALRALADDQQVAMTVGIDVDQHLAIAWAMAGVLSVVAGVLWAFVTGSGLSLALVGLRVFPIVVIGGLDSIPGTIVGAMVIGVLESLAAGYLDPVLGAGFSTVSPYAILLAVLFVRPHGLFGRADVRRV
jgi:branched-chain amino acid transport system permease protein